ncbi:MAG: hypothetical protein ACK5KO_12300 [Arachnia sp.]
MVAMLIVGIVIALAVLRHNGRLGPLSWDPQGAPALPGPAPAVKAEYVLAERLADGELTGDEYLERLSLLQER